MARGKSLSVDLRQSIIKAHINGESSGKISKIHSIPRSTVRDIINLYKTSGGVKEKKKNGRPSRISEDDERALKRIVKSNRLSTAKEITAQWRQIIGKPVSVSTTRRGISKMGYKFYKVFTEFCCCVLIM